MSAVKDAINAIRETLLLSEKIQRVAEGVTQLTTSVADHERRLIQLETRWDTAIQFSMARHLK